MTTEAQAPPASAPEAPPEKAAAGGEQADPIAVAEAKAAAAEARAVKLENDLRAAQGRRRPQEDIAALRERFEEAEVQRQEAEAANRAILKALVRGQTGAIEPEQVQREMDEVDRRTTQTVAERRFITQHDSLLAQLLEINTGDDGKPILGWETEDIANIVTRWKAATEKRDLGTITDLLAKSATLINREVRAQAKKQAETHDKEKAEVERKAREQALKDAGVFDGSAGAGGYGGGTDQEWLNRYADEERGEIPSSHENSKRAQGLLAKGLRPRARQ